MAKVLSVGNIVVDLICKPERDLPKWGRICAVDNPIQPHIGGNGAIFAVYLSKLIKDCALVGCIGDDVLGAWLQEVLAHNNVGMEHVVKVKKPTSVSVALVDKDARRAFLHYIGANSELEISSVPEDFTGASWMHLCSPFLMPKLQPRSCTALLKKAKDAGLYTSLDLVWDPSEEWNLDKMGSFCDILFLNLDEGEAITGADAPLEMLDMMATQGQCITVLKMGDSGCAVKLRSGGSFFAPSFEVKPVDTTGAGDAFNAGFILGMLNELERSGAIGKAGPKKTKKKGTSGAAKDILDIFDAQSLKKVALLGNALGAISVTQIGGTNHPPTQKELLTFVKTQKKGMVLE